MLHIVADLLQALARKEAEMLAAYDIAHAPTIGAMYEGLTSKVLNAAMPPSLDLRVVSGFVTAGKGKTSGEIDCMVVRGTGEVIPNTSKYKWPVQDVVAVVEVKKTLYSAGLADAYETLRDARNIFRTQVREVGSQGPARDVSAVYEAFRNITGRTLTTFAEVEALPERLRLMFHTLVAELISPVCVMFGYQGFASEKNFRDSFSQFLAERRTQHGYRVLGMPQLCISNGYSLVKLNGYPIFAPMVNDEWWPILASSTTNPLQFLLAQLWFRIESFVGCATPWDTLSLDNSLTPFLSARVIEADGQIGWQFHELRMSA